jgi:peptide methionine sulfoxide reductase MsrA
MQKQRKTKYQIAETKQISCQNYTITPKHKTNLQKLNTNTKLQKLKGRRNTKIITETDEIPNFTEAEDKISLQKIFGALP